MKRIVAAVLATLLLFSGCSLIEKIGDLSPTTAPNDAYLAEYKDGWAYACLSAEQQSNYGAVYAAVRDGFGTDATVTLDNSGTTYCGISITLPEPVKTDTDIRELYQAFTQDNPAFFHLGNAYGYSGITVAGTNIYDTLTLTYTMTAEERAAAQTALHKQRDELLGLLREPMTDFDKELVLHDALLSRCEYNDAAAADTQNEIYANAFTAYGALVEGSAVCEGYAHAMQYLLHHANIAATVVIGYDAETGEPHMWNAVVLDGKRYYLDPTWNDGGSEITYTFFNVTTADMVTSHRTGDETLGVEITADTEHNYYRMTGNYLDTMDQKKIAEHVAGILTAGKDTAHLRFSPETYDNALFFIQNAAWFTETVNACLPVGVLPLHAYWLISDEKYNTVTICKKTS